MLSKYTDSILFKAIAMVLVCLFIANDIAWAAPQDHYASKSATLAPPTQMRDPEFRTNFMFTTTLRGVPLFNKLYEWTDKKLNPFLTDLAVAPSAEWVFLLPAFVKGYATLMIAITMVVYTLLHKFKMGKHLRAANPKELFRIFFAPAVLSIIMIALSYYGQTGLCLIVENIACHVLINGLAMTAGLFDTATLRNEPGNEELKDSTDSLLETISEYSERTLRNTLNSFANHVLIAREQKMLDTEQTETILHKVKETLKQLNEVRLREGLKKNSPETEKRKFIRYVMSLRDKHVGLIDSLIITVAQTAPRVGILNTKTTLYKNGMVEFFDELEDLAAEMGIKIPGGKSVAEPETMMAIEPPATQMLPEPPGIDHMTNHNPPDTENDVAAGKAATFTKDHNNSLVAKLLFPILSRLLRILVVGMLFGCIFLTDYPKASNEVDGIAIRLEQEDRWGVPNYYTAGTLDSLREILNKRPDLLNENAINATGRYLKPSGRSWILNYRASELLEDILNDPKVPADARYAALNHLIRHLPDIELRSLTSSTLASIILAHPDPKIGSMALRYIAEGDYRDYEIGKSAQRPLPGYVQSKLDMVKSPVCKELLHNLKYMFNTYTQFIANSEYFSLKKTLYPALDRVYGLALESSTQENFEKKLSTENFVELHKTIIQTLARVVSDRSNPKDRGKALHLLAEQDHRYLKDAQELLPPSVQEKLNMVASPIYTKALRNLEDLFTSSTQSLSSAQRNFFETDYLVPARDQIYKLIINSSTQEEFEKEISAYLDRGLIRTFFLPEPLRKKLLRYRIDYEQGIADQRLIAFVGEGPDHNGSHFRLDYLQNLVDLGCRVMYFPEIVSDSEFWNRAAGFTNVLAIADFHSSPESFWYGTTRFTVPGFRKKDAVFATPEKIAALSKILSHFPNPGAPFIMDGCSMGGFTQLYSIKALKCVSVEELTKVFTNGNNNENVSSLNAKISDPEGLARAIIDLRERKPYAFNEASLVEELGIYLPDFNKDLYNLGWGCWNRYLAGALGLDVKDMNSPLRWEIAALEALDRLSLEDLQGVFKKAGVLEPENLAQLIIDIRNDEPHLISSARSFAELIAEAPELEAINTPDVKGALTSPPFYMGWNIADIMQEIFPSSYVVASPLNVRDISINTNKLGFNVKFGGGLQYHPDNPFRRRSLQVPPAPPENVRTNSSNVIKAQKPEIFNLLGLGLTMFAGMSMLGMIKSGAMTFNCARGDSDLKEPAGMSTAAAATKIPSSKTIIQAKLLDIQANKNITQGKLEEALQLLLNILEFDSKNKYALTDLARVYLKMRRYDEAISSLDKVLSEYPEDLPARTVKAQVLIGFGNNNEAIAVCDEVLRMDPNNMPARALKDKALNNLDKPPAAGISQAVEKSTQNPVKGAKTFNFEKWLTQPELPLLSGKDVIEKSAGAKNKKVKISKGIRGRSVEELVREIGAGDTLSLQKLKARAGRGNKEASEALEKIERSGKSAGAPRIIFGDGPGQGTGLLSGLAIAAASVKIHAPVLVSTMSDILKISREVPLGMYRDIPLWGKIVGVVFILAVITAVAPIILNAWEELQSKRRFLAIENRRYLAPEPVIPGPVIAIKTVIDILDQKTALAALGYAGGQYYVLFDKLDKTLAGEVSHQVGEGRGYTKNVWVSKTCVLVYPISQNRIAMITIFRARDSFDGRAYPAHFAFVMSRETYKQISSTIEKHPWVVAEAFVRRGRRLIDNPDQRYVSSGSYQPDFELFEGNFVGSGWESKFKDIVKKRDIILVNPATTPRDKFGDGPGAITYDGARGNSEPKEPTVVPATAGATPADASNTRELGVGSRESGVKAETPSSKLQAPDSPTASQGTTPAGEKSSTVDSSTVGQDKNIGVIDDGVNTYAKLLIKNPPNDRDYITDGGIHGRAASNIQRFAVILEKAKLAAAMAKVGEKPCWINIDDTVGICTLGLGDGKKTLVRISGRDSQIRRHVMVLMSKILQDQAFLEWDSAKKDVMKAYKYRLKLALRRHKSETISESQFLHSDVHNPETTRNMINRDDASPSGSPADAKADAMAGATQADENSSAVVSSAVVQGENREDLIRQAIENYGHILKAYHKQGESIFQSSIERIYGGHLRHIFSRILSSTMAFDNKIRSGKTKDMLEEIRAFRRTLEEYSNESNLLELRRMARIKAGQVLSRWDRKGFTVDQYETAKICMFTGDAVSAKSAMQWLQEHRHSANTEEWIALGINRGLFDHNLMARLREFLKGVDRYYPQLEAALKELAQLDKLEAETVSEPGVESRESGVKAETPSSKLQAPNLLVATAGAAPADEKGSTVDSSIVAQDGKQDKKIEPSPLTTGAALDALIEKCLLGNAGYLQEQKRALAIPEIEIANSIITTYIDGIKDAAMSRCSIVRERFMEMESKGIPDEEIGVRANAIIEELISSGHESKISLLVSIAWLASNINNNSTLFNQVDSYSLSDSEKSAKKAEWLNQISDNAEKLWIVLRNFELHSNYTNEQKREREKLREIVIDDFKRKSKAETVYKPEQANRQTDEQANQSTSSASATLAAKKDEPIAGPVVHNSSNMRPFLDESIGAEGPNVNPYGISSAAPATDGKKAVERSMDNNISYAIAKMANIIGGLEKQRLPIKEIARIIRTIIKELSPYIQLDRYYSGRDEDSRKNILGTHHYGFQLGNGEYMVITYSKDGSIEYRKRSRVITTPYEIEIPKDAWIEDVLARIQELIANINNLLGDNAVDFVWVFGSFADGDWTRDMDDVDLFIKLKNKEHVTWRVQQAVFGLCQQHLFTAKTGYIEYMDPYIYYSPVEDSNFIQDDRTVFEGDTKQNINNIKFMFKVKPVEALEAQFQNTAEIENALQVFNKLTPKIEEKSENRYFIVKYNKTKLLEGITDSANSPEEVISTYVKYLGLRLPENSIKLEPTSGKDGLISVECYSDSARSESNLIGKGSIDIEEDISGKPLRIIGMLNIAFFASQVIKDAPSEDYFMSFIRKQCRNILGADMPDSNIIFDPKKGLQIKLPHAGKIPLNTTLEEYYRVMIERLNQSA